MTPAISVCVPVYNGAAFLPQTLDSLLAQTFGDFEIVVSDNASTDGTDRVIAEYERRDKRVRGLRNAENIGYCRNILSAVEAARAPIVAIYHADDIYDPRILEREYALLASDTAIAGVFAHPSVFSSTPADGRKLRVYTDQAKMLPFDAVTNTMSGELLDFLPILLRQGNLFACPSFMTRKEVFFGLGGFTDTYPSNEDLELWIRYLRAGHKLAIVNEYLLNYRMSGKNASSFWKKKPELPVMYSVLEDLIVNAIPLNPQQRTLYAINKSIGYLRAAMNALLVRDSSLAHRFLDESKRLARLPFLTPFGLIQRFPFIAGSLYRLIQS